MFTRFKQPLFPPIPLENNDYSYIWYLNIMIFSNFKVDSTIFNLRDLYIN